MATVDLSTASNPDEVALQWARFLIDSMVEDRESKTRPVLAALYVFEMDNGVPSLPTLPMLFLPEDETSAEVILGKHTEPYAYLAMTPGLPVPRAVWQGEGQGQAKKQPLGVPEEIIEKGDFDWYLMAVFVSPSIKMTFCGGFDGDKFSQIKCIRGTYGGYLSDLFRTDS
jgi:hypothetical protein